MTNPGMGIPENLNPEMMRLVQEELRRLSPDDLARMQRHMVSNPDLIRLASESFRNMRPEDFKRPAHQPNQTRLEEILCMLAKDIANAEREEFTADAQLSPAISGAKMLKQRGNELHGRGQYVDAAAKYKLAKDSAKNIPLAAGQALQLECALNLMSCYLKSAKLEECVDEGSEVLTYDSSNVKAYYRRGLAYKELGNLQAAVADLSRAHEISPGDETLAEVLRDAQGKLAVENPDEVSNQNMDLPRSLGSPPSTADMQDAMRNAMEDPAMREILACMLTILSPGMMANMSRQFGMELSMEDAAKARHAMSLLSPEDLHKMIKWVEGVQRQQAVQVAKKAKNSPIARKGLIMAIIMLIVAFILHWLGFICR